MFKRGSSSSQLLNFPRSVGYRGKILLTILALTIAASCLAQDGVSVKGIVADSASHRPIAFVNVLVKNSSHGTTTDKNGYFALTAIPTDTIQFSYVGYKTLEFPVRDWEPSVILLPEDIIVLNNITIRATPLGDPYEHLFDEENMRLKNANRPIPFYYPKDKKDKILLSRAIKEQERVKHYVDLVVKDDKVRNELMKKHKLTEQEYYDILAKFNEKNYAIMYYLTDAELLSLLYRFYVSNSK